MALSSDLFINVSKLDARNVSDSDKQLNEMLISVTQKGPPWFEVGAAKYREMMLNGETSLPKPVYLEQAQDIQVPSREEGRSISCRVLLPENSTPVKGVYYHIHGGGWVLMSEKDQDTPLQNIANEHNLAVVSVGYRLAPEHPFPCGPEDCYDVGEWLVDGAEERFGAPLRLAGGESSGGHLTALVVFHLTKTRPAFAFAGLILSFGVFDLSLLPLVRHINRPTAMINKEVMQHFVGAFAPNMSSEQRRDPSISPLYADLCSMKLPPALFLCGTDDCLLEDTVMMALRWQMMGGGCVTKLFAGAPHGFTMLPQDKSGNAKEGVGLMHAFLEEKLNARE